MSRYVAETPEQKALRQSIIAKDYDELTPEELKELKSILGNCSGGVSWFYRTILHKEGSALGCCEIHDMAYNEGAPKSEAKAARKLADKRLRNCVREAGSLPTTADIPKDASLIVKCWLEVWIPNKRIGRKVWRWFKAWIMYFAVRIFSGPYFKAYDDPPSK